MGLQEEIEGGFREKGGRGGWSDRDRKGGLIKKIAVTGGNMRRKWTVGPTMDVLIGPRDGVGGGLRVQSYRTKGGKRNTDQLWVVVDISHAGTELGRDVKMTRGGGALAVYYICDHETEFGEWPGIEGVRRDSVLGHCHRGALRDLLFVASSDPKRIQ